MKHLRTKYSVKKQFFALPLLLLSLCLTKKASAVLMPSTVLFAQDCIHCYRHFSFRQIHKSLRNLTRGCNPSGARTVTIPAEALATLETVVTPLQVTVTPTQQEPAEYTIVIVPATDEVSNDLARHADHGSEVSTEDSIIVEDLEDFRAAATFRLAEQPQPEDSPILLWPNCCGTVIEERPATLERPKLKIEHVPSSVTEAMVKARPTSTWTWSHDETH